MMRVVLSIFAEATRAFARGERLNIKEEYDGYDMYCRSSVKFRNKYKVRERN